MHQIYFEILRQYLEYIPNDAIGAFINPAQDGQREILSIYPLHEIHIETTVIAEVHLEDVEQDDSQNIPVLEHDTGVYRALYLKEEDKMWIEYKAGPKNLMHLRDEEDSLFILKKLSWRCSYAADDDQEERCSYLCTEYRPLQELSPELYHGKAFYQDEDIFQLMYDHGHNLFDFLNQTDLQLSGAEFDDICLSIIQNLDTLHKQGLIHTDIKLDNICIQSVENQYHCSIIDLDEAYILNNEATAPQFKSGTLTYFPPEFFKQGMDVSPYNLFLRLTQVYDDVFANDYFNEDAFYAFYLEHLKQDWLRFFSTASDVYALGMNLLPYLAKYTDSKMSAIIAHMLEQDPAQRIDLSTFRDTKRRIL